MSSEPMTREERDAMRARCLRDIEHRRIVGMTRETVEVDQLLYLLDAEERAERAEKRTERLRAALGQISTGFPLAGYAHSVAMKALAADDAARGER